MPKSAFSLKRGDRAEEKEVKILRFHAGPGAFKKAEQELTRLVNDGWRIVTCSGGIEVGSGLVILQKE